MAVSGGDDVISGIYNTFSFEPFVLIASLMGIIGYVFGLIGGLLLGYSFFDLMNILVYTPIIPLVIYSIQTIQKLYKKLED
jgi:hypothetical protein